MYHNHQAIVNLFGGNGPLCLSFEPHDDHTVSDLKRRLASMTHIDTTDQRISTLGGRPLSDDDLLFNDPQGPVTFNLSLRLLGGKGGFGSMLRAQGGRMNAQKTTNFEACRDLQGRRIRTVNEERRLQDALAAQPEIERARQEAIKKKIEDGLKEREPKKFRFDDTQFLEDREQAMEGVKSAVSSILKKQTKKPKQQVVAMSLLFDDEMDDDDDEDDEEDDDEQPNDAEGDSESQQQQDAQKSSSEKESTKDKGKGKMSTTSSKGKQSASSSGNDDNEEDDNENNNNNKNLLSDFMEANYDEEYDSEEDEDFEENDEDEGSSSDEDLEEEDFEAEEEEDEPTDTAAATKASSSGSSKEDKGKGKVTRKRKERDE